MITGISQEFFQAKSFHFCSSLQSDYFVISPLLFLSKRPNYILLQLNDLMDNSMVPLDQEMQAILPKVLSHFYLRNVASKHTKIRINSWLSRLELIICNNTWRKNRNNYVKLLYVMLECGEILEPFTAIAPEEIPTLQRHQINCILLKLNTRLKEKERDKENREGKGMKANVYDLWNSLQGAKGNNVSNLSNDNGLRIQIKDKMASNFDSIAIDYLSPISQGVHARTNSNISECTYSSIQKYRDMLSGQEAHEDKRGALAQCVNRDFTKEGSRLEPVKYFKNNRKKQILLHEKEKETGKQGFYHKLLLFLRKHQSDLHEDEEYAEVLQELEEFLHLSPFPSKTQDKPDPYHEKLESSGLQNVGKEKKEEANFSLLDIDENSYDYVSGKYSEYSSIQMDSGISPSRIKFLNDQPQEGKKNILNYETKGPETISSFRKGISVQQSSRARQKNEANL